MDFLSTIKELNYNCFSKIFYSQSSREKKQILLEYSIGKTVRDDKVRKLYSMFVNAKIKEEDAKSFMERFFLQNTFYANPSMREEVKKIICDFLDYSKISHSEGMLEGKGVEKLKKTKTKHYKAYLQKNELSQEELFIFLIYILYTSIEYNSKELLKFAKEYPGFEYCFKSQ